jgi:type VI protein secretion system component VasK
MEQRELRSEINRVLVILFFVAVAAIVVVAIGVKVRSDRALEEARQERAKALDADLERVRPYIDALEGQKR